MSDPRNIAHDKKVKHEKEHQKPQPADGGPAVAVAPEEEHGPTILERSVVVLSKLKEMEFHSRANIETLAELMLTIEDELKQKDFSESIEAVYSAQDGFHTKVAALIEAYAAECERLKPSL